MPVNLSKLSLWNCRICSLVCKRMGGASSCSYCHPSDREQLNNGDEYVSDHQLKALTVDTTMQRQVYFFCKAAMEPFGDSGRCALSPHPDSRAAVTPGWAFFHKSIIVIVMGSLMSVVGGLLFLLRSLAVAEVPHSVASACVSIGLMFVAMGLVWIPILKEKRRRKLFSHGT